MRLGSTLVKSHRSCQLYANSRARIAWRFGQVALGAFQADDDGYRHHHILPGMTGQAQPAHRLQDTSLPTPSLLLLATLYTVGWPCGAKPNATTPQGPRYQPRLLAVAPAESEAMGIEAVATDLMHYNCSFLWTFQSKIPLQPDRCASVLARGVVKTIVNLHITTAKNSGK